MRYQKAIELNPDDIEGYKHWGRALMKQRKYKEAIVKYKIASVSKILITTMCTLNEAECCTSKKDIRKRFRCLVKL